MTANPFRFADLLTRAINRIHANECKPKTIIRDELGYAAGREGRTAIDNWCRDGGHVPAELRICCSPTKAAPASMYQSRAEDNCTDSGRHLGMRKTWTHSHRT